MLRPHEQRILIAVHRYHYLTNEQITRLFYSPGSLSTVQGYTKALNERKILNALEIPMPPKTARIGGSAPLVYIVGPRGKRYLDELGIEPRRVDGKAPNFMQHTLDVNDVLIAAELIDGHGGLEFEGFIHERDLKRAPTHVMMDGRRRAVIPDAWVSFIDGQDRVAITIELDRGTIEQRRIRQKFAAYDLWTRENGPYADAFNTEAFLLAYVTNTPRRRNNLLFWAHSELASQGSLDLAPFIKITAEDPKENPEWFFFGRHWMVPGDDELHPLFDTHE